MRAFAVVLAFTNKTAALSILLILSQSQKQHKTTLDSQNPQRRLLLERAFLFFSFAFSFYSSSSKYFTATMAREDGIGKGETKSEMIRINSSSEAIFWQP
jgi:hypothetical protein